MSSPAPELTLILEWENVLLAEDDRCFEMLRQLRKQLGEIGRSAEVIVLHNPEQVESSVIETPCPNASASLFTGAKVAQFSLLPQGQAERDSRVLRMVNQMDEEGFGNCSNHAECEAVCPKEISITTIARMRRDYFRATIKTGAFFKG